MSMFQEDVRNELAKARAKYRPMASAHEGWAVLREEVEEALIEMKLAVDRKLWEEVKKKPSARNATAIYEELVQVSAMAQRMAEDIVLTGKVREI
jgi:hypothetical protein